MANRSHYNSGHMAMNKLKKDGKKHVSEIEYEIPKKSFQNIIIEDAIDFIKKIPDSSIQLVLIDPPYNIDLAEWDNFDNYLEWAKQWLNEIERILTNTGNFVIFGGFQYQSEKKGDLLEIMHYLRHNTNLRFVNFIIWYYKNGMSAHRFFANRHEEILWFSKTKKYYFDLDSVRVPYDEKTKKAYLKDKRLNPETVEKGKNPTNVWEIPRLNGNSKKRVGHPTQKPIEVITPFVKALAFPGSVVLDFFAGSGTTGIACIEENRNCIMVDNDEKTIEYFKKHIESGNYTLSNYELLYDLNLDDYFDKIKNCEKENHIDEETKNNSQIFKQKVLDDF